MKFNKYIFLILFLIVNVVTCARYLDRSQHILYNRPEWISVKSIIPNGIVAAQEFIYERQTLALDRLNLGAWGGFQEVFWNQSPQWQELNFNANLGVESYLWIFLLDDNANRIGFRISRHPLYKSGFFNFNNDREITKAEYFDWTIEEKSKITLSRIENKLVLKVNEQVLATKELSGVAAYLFFKSSFNPIWIDNLELTLPETTLTEDFSPQFFYLNWIISILVNLLVAGLVLFISKKIKFNYVQTSYLFFLIIITNIVWYFIDSRLISVKHYNISFKTVYENILSKPDHFAEYARKNFLYQLYNFLQDEKKAFLVGFKYYQFNFYMPENINQMPEVLKKVFTPNGLESNSEASRNKYISNTGGLMFLDSYSALQEQTPAQYNILFMGDSQYYGGGVFNLEKSLTSLLSVKLLNCSKKSLAIFNFSSPGDASNLLMSKYQQIKKYWKPHLVFLSMTHNNKDALQFETNLKQTLAEFKADNIKVILLDTPSSPEVGNEIEEYKNNKIKEIAVEYGQTYIELQDFLNSAEVYDSGLIWWDKLHFDQAGHSHLAEEIFTQMNFKKLGPCF